MPRTDAVRIDLVESLPAAEVSRGFTTLEFDDSAQASLLTAGWGPMARPSEDEAFAWTSGRVAVVDVSLVDTRPRQLVLDVSSFDPPGSLPDQRLRVLWNGRLLRNAKVSKESQQLRLPVPSRAQFVGPNRIELQPRYWMGGGRAQRGVLVSRLSVEGVSADQQSGPAATAEDGSAIAQELDSVVTYWLLMPAGARLRGAVRLEGESPGDKAEAAVYVMEEAGEQQRVAAVGGARLGDGGRPIDVDLGAESPRAVALTLAATGPADGARVIWSDLRIEAERRVPPGRDWARRKYNVIFVLLDTLRADHTEPYGSTAVQTPRMRELADAGVTFTNAYSTASFTRSAVASLFTSLYPEAHRVLTREDNLTAELAGLPAALRDHGFATLALINNSHVGVQFGFGNGFDRVEEVYSSPIRKEFRKTDGPRQHAEAVWSRLVQPFLDQHSGKPFFLYLHEIDPHGPYMPKAPYNRMYDFGYTGRLSSHSQVLRAINQGEISVEDEDVRHFLSQYDGEISYMDEYLGWIVDHLRESGLERDTLLVLLSDHGEEFMEHGRLGHMTTVYDEVLRVPLVFHLPGALPAGARPAMAVDLVDVAPTVFDLLGLPSLSGAQGRSLLPRIDRADDATDERPIFAMVSVGEWRRSAVRWRNWKLILEEKSDGALPPSHRLFDLDRDSMETVDRWPSEPLVGGALAQALRLHRLRSQSAGPAAASRVDVETLDPKILENLRMLGYIE